MSKLERERRKFARDAQDKALAQQQRLIGRIELLGGMRPEPWPHAVRKVNYRKGQRRVTVDTALYNLQLLETVERLESGRSTVADIARESASDRAFNEVQRTGK